MTVVPLTRAATLGGSDAAAACGVDPYRSRVMLWLEKTGQYQRPETEAMLWGTLLEPVIMDVLAQQGYDPEPADQALQLVDSERAWMTCHPDGSAVVNGERGLLEVKTAGVWAWRGDEPPIQYRAQCLHNMWITGYPWALLATLVGGQKLHTHVIHRDEQAIGLMLALEADFMACLANGTKPAYDGHADETEALKALYPHASEGSRVRLTVGQMSAVNELRARREQEQAVKAQRLALENQIKDWMGDAETAISPTDEVVARWTNTVRHAVDVARLKEEHPRIHARFLGTTETRRFTLA